MWNPFPEAGEILTWSGGCVDGKTSGRGRQIWRGSYGESVYEGEYRDGKRHGRGTLTFASGARYEGEYRDGNRHGHGTYTFADGDSYEGPFRDDKAHGHGIVMDNGSRYEAYAQEGCNRVDRVPAPPCRAFSFRSE